MELIKFLEQGHKNWNRLKTLISNAVWIVLHPIFIQYLSFYLGYSRRPYQNRFLFFAQRRIQVRTFRDWRKRKDGKQSIHRHSVAYYTLRKSENAQQGSISEVFPSFEEGWKNTNHALSKIIKHSSKYPDSESMWKYAMWIDTNNR